jgi:hypothetical protein
MPERETQMKETKTAGGGLAATVSDDADGDNQASPPIPVGDIQFFDNYLPPLIDGTYMITVQQEINEVVDPQHNTTQPLAPPYVTPQYFQVQGPQFTLDASQVYSVYPPPNALADYSGTIPHIVLNSRTLPWERTLDGMEPSADNQPWLALLLFDEDELSTGSPAGGSNNSTKTQLLPLSEVINLNPSGDILSPQITFPVDSPPAGSTCLAIDVDPQTFLSIAPQLSELPLLTHCRAVNTGNKEILGINADGWFSVVIANRKANCSQAGSPPAGTRNIAHLVSLEGIQDYLPGGTPIPGHIQRVRLVSLASWVFVCATTGLNFRQLMQNLAGGILQLPVDASPPTILTPSPPANVDELVKAAFQSGYVPLNYTTQQGEQTVGWCRGPLVPFPVERVERTPFSSADEAKIYDPNTGMFDLSYAVAWQLGRLLTLANKEFSVALLNWQQEANYLIDLIIEQQQQVQSYGVVLELPEPSVMMPARNGKPYVDRKQMLRSVATYLSTRFAERILAGAQEGDRLFGEGRDPTGIRNVRDKLPGLLPEEEVEELLATGTDPSAVVRRMFLKR